MKRSFALIEVLISFSLAIILLSIGTTLIYSFAQAKTRSTNQFETTLSHHMRCSQLRALLSTMVHVKERKPLLALSGAHPKDKKLLFTRNNGIFFDPQLANDVLALLFIDEDGLKVALHADPSRKDMEQTREKVYLLWPKAKDFSWQFLGKKNLSSQTLEWCDEWKEDEEMPLALRLTLDISEQKEKEIITAVIKESVQKKIPLSLEMTLDQMKKYAGIEEDDE